MKALKDFSDSGIGPFKAGDELPDDMPPELLARLIRLRCIAAAEADPQQETQDDDASGQTEA